MPNFCFVGPTSMYTIVSKRELDSQSSIRSWPVDLQVNVDFGKLPRSCRSSIVPLPLGHLEVDRI